MRGTQRAFVLRLRHHGVMTHLRLPSHLNLGHASQHGVPAALQAYRPPPPLQGVLVRSGLHPGNPSQHRIRAALVAHGPLIHRLTRHQYPGLGRGTGAGGTTPQARHLLSVTIDRLGGQEPSRPHRRILLNRAVQLACLVPPLHRQGFFSLLTEGFRLLLIRPGETRSPLPNQLLANVLKILHLPVVLHLPDPAPPSVPI
jgi:hypothetical protein